MNPRVLTIAAEIAHEIVDLVLLTILKERMENEGRQDVNEQDWNIVVEYTAFLLHATNRFAHAHIPFQRSPFITMCVFNAWSHLVKRMTDSDKRTLDELREQLRRLFDDREVEYSRYRWSSEKSQPLKGDLFWEFGDRIARMQGYKEDAFATFEASTQGMAMVGAMLEGLKIDERLERLGKETS